MASRKHLVVGCTERLNTLWPSQVRKAWYSKQSLSVTLYNRVHDIILPQNFQKFRPANIVLNHHTFTKIKNTTHSIFISPTFIRQLNQKRKQKYVYLSNIQSLVPITLSAKNTESKTESKIWKIQIHIKPSWKIIKIRNLKSLFIVIELKVEKQLDNEINPPSKDWKSSEH